MWRQRQLEEMHRVAKVKYRQKHPSSCTFFGTLIRCDMYRHVACCHLELAQVWRCPVSWCTVWKGAPQDLMYHVCGAHNVLREIKAVSLEKLFPPWTVARQVYTESLTSRHSGISNDVMLFRDIRLSLVHHYRVHKRGLLWLRSTRISSLFESVAHLEIFPCSPENVTCSPENFTCSPENFTFSPQNCTSSPVKCRYLPE